jgi:hypothetical protein
LVILKIYAGDGSTKLLDINSGENFNILEGEKVHSVHTGGNSVIFAASKKVFTVSGILDAKKEPKQFLSLIPSFSNREPKIIPGISLVSQLKASAFSVTEFDAMVDKVSCGFDHFLVFSKNASNVLHHKNSSERNHTAQK